MQDLGLVVSRAPKAQHPLIREYTLNHIRVLVSCTVDSLIKGQLHSAPALLDAESSLLAGGRLSGGASSISLKPRGTLMRCTCRRSPGFLHHRTANQTRCTPSLSKLFADLGL